MATNLKKKQADKKEESGEKAEKKGLSLDLKWVLGGLGLVAITMGSVIIGIQLAPNKVVVKETTKHEFVVKIPPKPGPSIPVMTGQVLNLAGGRYLRFSVVVQFAANEKLFPEGGGGGEGGKKKDPLEAFYPMLKDVIVAEASKHSADELLQPKGKEHLKDAIKVALNREFQAEGASNEKEPKPIPEVIRIFFTDFVIQ